MAKMPTIENMIDKALQNYVYPHINIDTCFNKPWNHRSIPPQSVELKFDIDPDELKRMFSSFRGRSSTSFEPEFIPEVQKVGYYMPKDYKEKLMKKRKYFKFKLIALEREDSITVDGNHFNKSDSNLEGYCYKDNDVYFCTAKIVTDECDIEYRALRFDTDYFFKEKKEVTEIPCEFIEDLK